MRKICIFISYFFLFSCSIYGHSDLIDISKMLNDTLSEEYFLNEIKRKISQNRSNEDSEFNVFFNLDITWGSYFSETDNDLKIVRQCPANKENFKDKVWEEYKSKIFSKCKDGCPSVIAEYTDTGSISVIRDLQDTYRPIRFYTLFMGKNKVIPLGNDKKNQLINKMKHITEYKYNFLELVVKVTNVGVLEKRKEKILPIAIFKNGNGVFFRNLEIDDSSIKITYPKPIEMLMRNTVNACFK
ncbi:MAG: hypothetical protein PUP46_01020 [Endozoicomonas sp. (ex Botrylloides leachii)]|nr:hypothetical protein [Endozoicomonas sp. (ex Botrylloides leachii)]